MSPPEVCLGGGGNGQPPPGSQLLWRWAGSKAKLNLPQ